jgi:hypothetical protein
MFKVRHAKRWVFYPWLFALYPIVYLYSANLSLVRDNEVLGAAAAAVAITTVVLLILTYLTKSAHTGAAITAIIVLAFFTYGHIYNTLDGTPSVQGWLLPGMIVAAVVLSLLMLKYSKGLPRLTPSLNLVSAFLLVMPLWEIGSYFFEDLTAGTTVGTISIERPSAPKITNDGDHPDVYYIIFDAYPSNTALMRDNNYDNSWFTDVLEERGFYVAYDSKSNYDTTLVSLPSSLNMRYIDSSEAPGTHDKIPYLRSLVANNSVALELQNRGYTYIDMLSGFMPPSSIADMNVDFYPDGPEYFEGSEIDFSADGGSWYYKQPFWPFFLETTMLRSVASQYELPEFFPAIIEGRQPDRPLPWHSPDRVRSIFSELEKIPEMPEATFTFAHLLKPHEPIRFDRDGNVIDYQVALSDEEYYYFEQLHYINTRILEMVDRILEESTVPPIIIMQADHGSILGYGKGKDGDLYNFEIFNAFYLPDSGSDLLYPSITPVNSFRIVLNHYFNTDYPLLEERFFSIPKGEDIFFRIEIVDDGRLNVGTGEHIALIYNGTDDDGAPEFHIHAPAEDGTMGDFLLAITQEQMTPYLDNAPAQNTLILREGPVAFYALTTGEFQFNIGPDDQGREWALVVDTLPARVVYGYQVGVDG